MSIVRCAQKKDQYRYGQPYCWEGIAHSPAHIVLYIYEESIGEKDAKEDAKHPPIEEGELVDPLPGLELVELVRAHGRDVGLGSAGSDSYYVQRKVEDAHLKRRGPFVAVVVLYLMAA